METLGLMDVKVRRNAFGSQIDSFEADLEVPRAGESRSTLSSSGPRSSKRPRQVWKSWRIFPMAPSWLQDKSSASLRFPPGVHP